jgi:hypothetical protein
LWLADAAPTAAAVAPASYRLPPDCLTKRRREAGYRGSRG